MQTKTPSNNTSLQLLWLAHKVYKQRCEHSHKSSHEGEGREREESTRSHKGRRSRREEKRLATHTLENQVKGLGYEQYQINKTASNGPIGFGVELSLLRC